MNKNLQKKNLFPNYVGIYLCENLSLFKFLDRFVIIIITFTNLHYFCKKIAKLKVGFRLDGKVGHKICLLPIFLTFGGG